MKNYTIIPILFKSGIQRDGTPYKGENCIDGQWVRFYEKSARKMGGYILTDTGTTEIVRSLFVVPKPNTIDLYIGRASSVNYLTIDIHGNAGVEVDRTPASGFTPDPTNLWTFDLFTASTLGVVTTYIVGNVAKNANDISNTEEGPIFRGTIDSTAPLTQIMDSHSNPVVASGGIVFVSPFMVAYGKDGTMRWCNAGEIDTWPDSNTAVVANTKLVAAFPKRGGASPTLLIWSLNSLNQSTYDGTTATFSSTTIEDNISIMSSKCIAKYNQMFFWVGVDQFYFYNGLVQKLQNTMNNDWFFQNVNLTQRQKIWSIAVPRYKEIWTFYPRGTSVECNAAVIYNLEEEVWYDTLIDRSAGVPTSIYPFPLWAGSTTVRTIGSSGITNTFPIWTHENGTNRVEGSNVLAIDSFFETRQIDLWSMNPESSNFLRNRRVAPDFIQQGAMTLTINNQKYPNTIPVSDGPYTFVPNTVDEAGISIQGTEKIDMASQGGIVSFVFRSNVVDGFYQSGKSLYFLEKGDTFK